MEGVVKLNVPLVADLSFGTTGATFNPAGLTSDQTGTSLADRLSVGFLARRNSSRGKWNSSRNSFA